MSDERPPLPETDDPFVLLGLGDDLDERGLKRAYARMIKIYRPDRAPAEFARIQAAYDQLTQLVKLGVRRIERVTVDTGELIHAFAAVEAEPRAAAAPAVDAEELALHLAGLCERGAAAEVLALVEDEAHAAAAERDPVLARHLLRAIATMAWYDLPWPRAMARYRELPHHHLFDDAIAAADFEVAAAAALRDPAIPSPPAPLVNLLRRRRRATDAERQELVRALARDLDRRQATYLQAFDELERRAPAAAAALADILALELPKRGEDLDSLPEQVSSALWNRVQPVEHLTAWVAGSAAATVIALVVLFHAAGVALALFLAIGAGVLIRELAALRYGPFVRGHAGRVLVAYAVPLPCLREALDRLDEPSWLYRFRHELAADRGLALLGLTATLARRRRLCWQPVLTELRDGPWPEDAGDPFGDPLSE